MILGGPPYARLRFVFALGHMGRKAVGALETLLSSEDRSVRITAACCLAVSGARGSAAIPVLMERAVRHDPYEAEIVEPGDEPLVGEDVMEDATMGFTSWIRESRDALVSIGRPALETLQKAAAEDPAVARRLAPTIEAIRKQKASK